jgi:hypothetical protein
MEAKLGHEQREMDDFRSSVWVDEDNSFLGHATM